MSDIKVTQAEIDLLLNSADVQVRTEFGKCTVVTVRLRNGFILTESSACVDPANYDTELGKRLCLQHIENRLWELEGYALQKRTDEEHAAKCEAAEVKTHDFGWALSKLRCGWPVRRRGWNGKGIFIKLQVPDEHSKMTSPYIYIDTTACAATIRMHRAAACRGWQARRTCWRRTGRSWRCGMDNLSAQQKLMGNMQATSAELLSGIMEERGRGFASDREAWAQLKENIENVESRMKAIKDVHKDMWSAVKDHNGDAFCALAGEFQRSAILLAMEWTNASVLANIAVLHGEDE